MEFFDAYILSYGLCYLLVLIKRDFYLIKPKLPIFVTKFSLFMIGVLHIIAVLYGFPLIIVFLAIVESHSCVAHYTGMLEWKLLKDLKSAYNAYLLMAVFDIIDAAFLFSKFTIKI